MYKILFALALILTQAGIANVVETTHLAVETTHFNDPWETVDERFKKEKLCEAFVDGEEYTFRHESCTTLGCDRWEYQVKVYCKTGSDGVSKAKVQHVQNGTPYSEDTITEQAWAGYGGNLLRNKGKIVESFGLSFALDRVEELPTDRLKAHYTIRDSGGRISEIGAWVLGRGPTIRMVEERHSTKYGLLTEKVLDVFVSKVSHATQLPRF